MTVITGVSGSGKSSLAFDTIYAEGQRRYVETFSSYARQFLDRMDRPAVDQIDNLPPAIAVDQSNPVRTSRSTVGTMTEINDHLKLLFARVSFLTCRSCGKQVQRDTAQSSLAAINKEYPVGSPLQITFTVIIPDQFSKDEIVKILASQGYSRVLNQTKSSIEVLLDRVSLNNENSDRIIDDLENAFHHGNGQATVYYIESDQTPTRSMRFSSELHCPDCDIYYCDPIPGMFSFNSPVGACEICRGFGRTIGIDYNLVIPDSTKSIVEHDPEVIRAADFIIDMGPGPGDHGGEIVFAGTFEKLLQSKESSTAHYLNIGCSIKKTVRQCTKKNSLHIKGAHEHNLKNIDVSIPLGALVCLTGVSGSGKSTLLEDIIYKGLRRLKGLPGETPGTFKSIKGYEQLCDIILVDQSPIGKTTRSNPASYVGAFDTIRALFAAQQESHQRGYTPGTFSFNAGTGRCPTCLGTGYEHVEMQFLSDVYLRCPDCDGKRFRNEILEIRVNGNSIYDILEMSVDTALMFFQHHPKVLKCIAPLKAVGLGYMRLGQPLPTLSGGEAQRLKLAGYLSEKSINGGNPHLFLFDEPTTGLHFADIEILLIAFHALIDAGHSVIIIEHNLDVISNADWIIDLGPEGGDAGGTLIYTGPSSEILNCKESYTGKALSNHLTSNSIDQLQPQSLHENIGVTYYNSPYIQITNAREHNLQSVNLSIPRDQLTVITGVSGSGKSTIAFDILFEEGRRRYLESLNAYARQFVQPSTRPNVDAISGLPPTVAIEQRTSRGGRKSTVATVTEIYHYLRLLFGKLGIQYCPDCSVAITPQTPEAIFATIMKQYRNKKIVLLAPLVQNRKGIYKDLAQWVSSKGYDSLRVDSTIVAVDPWPTLDRFKEHTIELPIAQIQINPVHENALKAAINKALEFGKGILYVNININDDPPTIYSTQRSCPQCQKSFEEPDPRLFSFNSKHGWCPECEGQGVKKIEMNFLPDVTITCDACGGARFTKETRAVLFKDQSISDVLNMSIDEAADFFSAHHSIAHVLKLLKETGLGYLSLGQPSPALSGGEAQRIKLITELSRSVVDSSKYKRNNQQPHTLYILDEPTVGLHMADIDKLIKVLHQLVDTGNTIIVIEHNLDLIAESDWIIDLGPEGGEGGGSIIAEGTPEMLLAMSKKSHTAYFLKEMFDSRVG